MARCVALLAALVLLAGTATVYAAPPKASDGTMLYQKTTKYIFDDEVVPVELGQPYSDIDGPKTFARFGSLIQVREDFIPELVKASEDL